MRFYGFATRNYLILKHLNFHKDSSVLEIGVGSGSMAEIIIGKAKEFYGVDISTESIDQLKSIYKYDNSVKFYTVDVCNNLYLGKKFDIIFSADTLEHVKTPRGFFKFIAKHLSPGGAALVIFPNESEGRHHGVSRFNSKEYLLNLIDSTGLETLDLFQVNKTCYHRLIESFLWKLPKSIVSKRTETLPQSYENTESLAINKANYLKVNLLSCYAKIVTRFAACFPLYNVIKIEKNINDKILLLYLKRKNINLNIERMRVS